MLKNSIWPIDRTLSGDITLSESGPMSNGSEGVFDIPQSSRRGASFSDCLVSYPGHSFVGSYPSTEMQSVYSTAPADWAVRSSWEQYPHKSNISYLFYHFCSSYIYIYIYIYVRRKIEKQNNPKRRI